MSMRMCKLLEIALNDMSLLCPFIKEKIMTSQIMYVGEGLFSVDPWKKINDLICHKWVVPEAHGRST